MNGNYEKPVMTLENEQAEGVYMASGDDCYSVTTWIHQKPETGRGDYRIQVDAKHAARDGHHSGEQKLVLTFNQAVTYKSSNGTLVGGQGTTELIIRYNYHNNAGDNIGLGDVVVESDPGLADPLAMIICNHDCGQH